MTGQTRTEFSELVSRLGADEASVRRIAAMDLARLGERGLAAICERLRVEKDEKALLVMVRALARSAPARPFLERLRDDASTPVRVYHAALIAVDGMS